jgi:hypothetical protein
MKPVCALAALVCLLFAACAEDDEATPERPAAEPDRPARPAGNPEHTASRRHRAALKHATCPAGASGCRTASGRIIYVEAVDPDGDGDAHFVLLSSESVTSPGLSVIDVRRSLRPSPLPRPGDRLSAAGPVERGSYGQRQIAATELHVAPGG